LDACCLAALLRRREMFGFEKEKIQLKSVEDYLRTQEILEAGSENGTTGEKGRAVLARIKPFVLPTIVILAVLLVVAAGFSQIMELRKEIAGLKVQKNGDLKALEQHVSDLAAKIDKSERQINLFRDDITGLEAGLETEKAERARVAAAATRKAAKVGKKKQAGGKPRP
jgi:hypothetical protein